MPKLSQKWTELFLAFDRARLQAYAMQESEKRRFSYHLLLVLLAASALGFLLLLIRR